MNVNEPDKLDFLDIRDDILSASAAMRCGLQRLPDHQTFRQEVLALQKEAIALISTEAFLRGSIRYLEDREDFKYMYKRLVVKYLHPDETEEDYIRTGLNSSLMSWIQLILDAIHNTLHY